MFILTERNEGKTTGRLANRADGLLEASHLVSARDGNVFPARISLPGSVFVLVLHRWRVYSVDAECPRTNVAPLHIAEQLVPI